MEEFARRVLSLCTACLLAAGVLAFPLQGRAATWNGGGEPSAPSLGSSSLEDLLRRLENREPDITLTGDIELDGDSALATAYNAPVTIHMGDYSIRMLEGAYLHLSGPLTFTGNGDTAPLFRLERNAMMVDYMGGVSITATGDAAMALSVGPGAYLLCPGLEIRATGRGSTALETQGDALLDGLNVTADHPDGIAISADGDLRLNHCIVSGEIHVAGNLTLDVTSVSPLPENGRIVKRRASWYHNYINLHVFGYCAVAGETAPLPEAIDLELADVDGMETLKTRRSIPVQWETGELDLSQPGSYTVYGTPQMHSPPGLEGVERTGIEVWIVEPGTPWLTGIGYYNNYKVTLDYLQPIEDARELRMYYSPDGENWELMDENQANLDQWGGSVYDLQREQLHYLQLEVIGGSFAGRSNILCFRLDESGSPDQGGSRDGTGQEGGEDPGPRPGEEDNTGTGNTGEDPAPSPGEEDNTGTGNTGEDPAPSPGEEDNAGAGNTDAGRTRSGGGSGFGRLDTDAAIPVFGAAEPIAEETPLPQPEEPTRLTLSAPQLSTLLEVNPRQLAFHEDGITAIIPSKLLAGLNLAERFFTVVLGMEGAGGFRVAFYCGDDEMTDLGGQAFQVWVPYEAGPEDLEHLYLLGAAGAEQPADDYQDGRLLFELRHTGSYAILDKRDAPEAGSEKMTADQQPPSQEEFWPVLEESEEAGQLSPLPVVFALTALLVAGGGLLLRRRGGTRYDGEKPE